MSDFKCESVPCVVCGSPSWTCDYTECGDPNHADGVAVAPEGWACSEACWEKAAEEASHGARVHQSERSPTPDEVYDALVGSVTGPSVARACPHGWADAPVAEDDDPGGGS